ncbi:Putative chemotaxis phosphatase, CheZ [Acidithiobacillus ferrivorans]|uniref:Chemotaxis phosphatase, CheZ n=3 Tax=Acidithiobacillus ferrivorans TaxID=160808 RepID=A0A060US35_9PROT|nr:putative Chemotaxis protein cheZ [Acidithiobacillus ferrivorans]SMH67478.1 Putative chemotaxis phosphatase, CheZ [Acidithiobacillus ferrivorans]
MTRRKARPAITTDCKSDTDRMQPLLTADSSVGMPTQSNGLRLLAEADLLLNEGLRRIAGAGDDLPDACNPIEEALALSETQTMNTLEALESAQAAIRRIESVRQGFIDKDILEIKAAMATILNSQQGQDLAGQRLKKALRLLHAVDDRISQALTSLQDAMGVPRMETVDIASTPEEAPFAHTDAPALDAAIHGKRVEQDDVDALLAELGI